MKVNEDYYNSKIKSKYILWIYEAVLFRITTKKFQIRVLVSMLATLYWHTIVLLPLTENFYKNNYPKPNADTWLCYETNKFRNILMKNSFNQ